MNAPRTFLTLSLAGFLVTGVGFILGYENAAQILLPLALANLFVTALVVMLV